jgi:hypothetical protein
VLPDGGAQPPLEHATPAGQHVRLVPEPQGVVFGGHPQKFWDASMHATPFAQQLWPHGVLPFGQQQPN